MRAVRYLPLAVACVVTLIWVGSASALIVPQHSIARIELGSMTRHDVRELKGPPDRVIHNSNDFGPYTEFIYLNEAGKLKASFQGNDKVTGIFTNRPTQKTAEGIHVGSSESALHDAYPGLHCRTEDPHFRHCWTGRFQAGRRVTDYRIGMATGKIKNITVAFVID